MGIHIFLQVGLFLSFCFIFLFENLREHRLSIYEMHFTHTCCLNLTGAKSCRSLLAFITPLGRNVVITWVEHSFPFSLCTPWAWFSSEALISALITFPLQDCCYLRHCDKKEFKWSGRHKYECAGSNPGFHLLGFFFVKVLLITLWSTTASWVCMRTWHPLLYIRRCTCMVSKETILCWGHVLVWFKVKEIMFPAQARDLLFQVAGGKSSEVHHVR